MMWLLFNFILSDLSMALGFLIGAGAMASDEAIIGTVDQDDSGKITSFRMQARTNWSRAKTSRKGSVNPSR